MKSYYPLLLASALIAPVDGIASPGPLENLQYKWSVCQYQTLQTNKEQCLNTLSQQAHEANQSSNNNDAGLLIWSAIIDSSLAGVKGGLSALGLVKEAKKDLEKAIKLDPNALQGSAWTSLGALYYQVPGWPVGFGDKAKAEEMLTKALSINPNGIDSNYFYGDFLLTEKRAKEAKRYLEKALHAEARPGRDVADNGRRQDILRDLDTLH